MTLFSISWLEWPVIVLGAMFFAAISVVACVGLTDDGTGFK